MEIIYLFLYFEVISIYKDVQKMYEVWSSQNAVATWHKFPNPGGAISTKNVLFPIQGAQF